MFARLISALLGFVFVVGCFLGIYWFWKLDGNPRYESNFIGVGEFCLIGAVLAAFLALGFLSRAFRRTR